MQTDTNLGQEDNSTEAPTLKPYHAPKFTNLGPIESLVRHNHGEGPDLGDTDNSAS